LADIRPFRGVHYNKSLIKDWSAVICPVYDIITPQQQQELYLRSEQNFIRMEFGRELPQDTATDNRYTRSAATLDQWLQQGILEVDEAPAIYLHNQYFTYQGKEYRRRGIIVRVRVEEWDRMVVRPHEGTLARPKSDRVSLLWALQANTSSILALFEDPGQRISSLLTAQEQEKPLIDSANFEGERHDIWAIKDPEAIQAIVGNLAEQPLYVADGHHRYESALTYKHERSTALPSASGDEEFNFVMMTLVDFTDPGLLILPPHRLVRGIPKSTLNELMSKLRVFFEVEEFSLSAPDVWEQVDRLLAETDDVRLTLFGPAVDRIFVLKLREVDAVSQMMPYFHSELYKRLDVSIVDHIVLENLLELSTEKEETHLAYSYDRLDAVRRVSAQEYQLALLVNPVKPEIIKSIADIGDKMPRKSTYFYPKLPAGLVFNRFV